jgi:hypothetical protein
MIEIKLYHDLFPSYRSSVIAFELNKHIFIFLSNVFCFVQSRKNKNKTSGGRIVIIHLFSM